MGQEEKKYSILDELAKSNGYEIALMTTFNFEIGFFERAILNRLYACDVKKVSLFVDSKELNKALNEVNTCYLGKRYMVTPVEMNGSFHPKVILLLGKKKAKLFVGSSNIKTSGYAINNEIFNFVEYSPEHSEYLDVINAAIDFFAEINEKTCGLDSGIIKEAKSQIYYHKTESNGTSFLLHNIDEAILDQTNKLISDTIREVCIAVPYYDNGLNAFSAIKNLYTGAELKLYIQDKKSTIPVELFEKNNLSDTIVLFSGFENAGANCCDNFYHGKIFLFRGISHDYILYGSANCTQSALAKTYTQGGNIECDLLEIGEVGEFDYFFESMKLVSGKKPECSIMAYDNDTAGNYWFRYGKLNSDVELHVGYSSKKNDLKVRLQDLDLKYQYVDDELIVILPEEYRTSISDIFEISFQYEGISENVRCWYFNVAEIENYRAKQIDRGSLDSFDIDANGDKFVEDRINLLKAELTSLPEFLEHKKNVAIYNQIKQELEGDDLESQDEDFIVDVPITDEYRTSYRQYCLVAKIRRQFIRQFLLGDSSVFKLSQEGNGSTVKTDGNIDANTEYIYRPATSAEKRFERFIKAKVKGMLNDKYVEIIEPEHYVGIIAVVFDIFDKYNNKELVEDIFDKEYVIDTRLQFFSKLVGKDLSIEKEIEDFQDGIIAKCFSVIIDNHVIALNYQDGEKARKVESGNRDLLLQLEKKYQLRACYQQYIKKAIVLGESSVWTLGNDRSCQYIEELYDYKNLDMLAKYIQSKYENATVELKGKYLYIIATTEVMRDHHRPLSDVLREIGKYSRNVSTVDYVTINIQNVAPNPENKNIIVHIKHYISMSYHKWRATETRVDGSKYDSKSQFISF